MACQTLPFIVDAIMKDFAWQGVWCVERAEEVK